MPPKSTSGKPPLNSSRTSRSGKTDVNMISVSGQITSPTRSSSFPASNLQTPSKIYDAATPPDSKPHVSGAFDSLTEHPLYALVQSVDKSLRAFFEHDWETNPSYKLTRLHFYNILLHFDSDTKARPHHPKPSLILNFKTNLLPRLRPFCSLPPPPVPPPMDTDLDEDFDPLDPRTTIPMLLRAITAKKPNIQTSAVALKSEILSLYKHYVNPQLKLPAHSFTKTPNIVKSNSVDRLTIKQIQHAVHCYHPELFLNDPVLRLSHYRRIYRAYVIEEEKKPDDEDLVEGYHYWTNKGLVETQ